MRQVGLDRFVRPLASGLALVALLITGCSGTLGDTIDKVVPKRQPSYQSSKSLPPLEVPPDLSSASINDTMQIPQGGSTTYSDYASGRKRTVAAQDKVLPHFTDVRVERSGDKRWLVVKASPAQVWPKVRSFWLSQGFLIAMEDPSIGIMETDWAEKREQFKSGFIKGLLSKLSNALYGAATRDKFRTRLERGTKPGTTEIYITNRGAEEVSSGQLSHAADATGGEQTMVWQPRPADPELEAEMLNRMMVYFGVKEQRASEMIAKTRDHRERAHMIRTKNGARALSLDEGFASAWRRTGLALDRVGFTVEDRDRSRGLYYVRYVDPNAPTKSDQGFFSKLKFWDSAPKKREDAYLISLIGGHEGESKTEVVVLNDKGKRDSSATANRILSLLHEQLR